MGIRFVHPSYEYYTCWWIMDPKINTSSLVHFSGGKYGLARPAPFAVALDQALTARINCFKQATLSCVRIIVGLVSRKQQAATRSAARNALTRKQRQIGRLHKAGRG